MHPCGRDGRGCVSCWVWCWVRSAGSLTRATCGFRFDGRAASVCRLRGCAVGFSVVPMGWPTAVRFCVRSVPVSELRAALRRGSLASTTTRHYSVVNEPLRRHRSWTPASDRGDGTPATWIDLLLRPVAFSKHHHGPGLLGPMPRTRRSWDKGSKPRPPSSISVPVWWTWAWRLDPRGPRHNRRAELKSSCPPAMIMSHRGGLGTAFFHVEATFFYVERPGFLMDLLGKI